MIKIYIGIFGLIIQFLYAVNVEMEVFFPKVNVDWLYDRGGDLFRYSYFNMFDGKSNTCWAEGLEGDGSGKGKGIVFRKSISIDKIRILPGNAKTYELWLKNNKPKTIHLILVPESSTVFDEEYGGIVRISKLPAYERLIILPNQYGYFDIEVPSFCTNIKMFTIIISNTYPGTMYDDTCISEIEFWYRGQKYEVANLEEAKREFVRKVREKARWGVGDPYDTETYIKESGPEVERRLAGYGITNVEVLDMTGKMDIVGKRASVIRVRKWVPAEGMGYRMVLYAQKKGSGLKKRKVTTRDAEADVGEYEYELREVVKIGEAKVDENGTTWAKLGNSEWRAVVITSGYGRMLMSDYFEAFGIGDVDSEGHVAPFPEE